MMNYRSRYAFTLIEILVVLSIVGVLSGFILSVAGATQDTAEDIQTRARMDQVRNHINQFRLPSGRSIPMLAWSWTRGGQEVQWRSIHAIVRELGQEYGSGDPTTLAVGPYFPPGVVALTNEDLFQYCILDNSPFKESFFKLQESVRRSEIDDQNNSKYGWNKFHRFYKKIPRTIESMIHLTERKKTQQISGDFLPLSTSTNSIHYLRQKYSRSTSGIPLHGEWYLTVPDERIFTSIDIYTAPSTGETIRSAQDVFPVDGVPMPDWLDETDEYESIWPVLSQTYGTDNEPQWYAWPETDWQTAADESSMNQTMPIWEAPFGQRVLDRLTGQLTDFFITRRDGPSSSANILPARNLAEFSPVNTLDLLTATEILPQTDAGAVWRSDRSASELWNDPWGNPLVLSLALFIAPRYGFEPSLESSPTTQELTLDLLGGRNWLQQVSREAYGTSQELYLSIGALGPERIVYDDASQPGDSSLPPKLADWSFTAPSVYAGNAELDPLVWTAGEDFELMRTAWAQVATITEAAEFEDFDMAEKPDDWENGVRRVFDGTTQERVYLTAPIAVR